MNEIRKYSNELWIIQIKNLLIELRQQLIWIVARCYPDDLIIFATGGCDGKQNKRGTHVSDEMEANAAWSIRWDAAEHKSEDPAEISKIHAGLVAGFYSAYCIRSDDGTLIPFSRNFHFLLNWLGERSGNFDRMNENVVKFIKKIPADYRNSINFTPQEESDVLITVTFL